MTAIKFTTEFVRRSLFVSGVSTLFQRPARASSNSVALVIGNGRYRSLPQLTNPASDARAIGLMLESMGVQTEVVIDAERRSLSDAIGRFSGRSTGKELAIVFFAGHGIQRYDENWLIPIDADINSVQDVRRRLLPLSQIMEASLQARQRVVILDACRDDPFSGSRADSGLARVSDTTPGTLIAFATSPGRVALDGSRGHSPFTDALLDHLGTPGLDLRQVLTRVRQRVLLDTDGRQVPWDTSSLTNDVVLRDVGQRPILRSSGASLPQGRQPRSSPQAAQRQNNAQGPVTFDFNRYREIPRTYLVANRAGHVLPQGILVQRRNEDGEETALCGSYFWSGDNSAIILISYNKSRETATFLVSHTARVTRQPANWAQYDGELENTVLRHVVNRTVRLRMDFTNGWANILHQTGRVGNLDSPYTTQFRRVE